MMKSPDQEDHADSYRKCRLPPDEGQREAEDGQAAFTWLPKICVAILGRPMAVNRELAFSH